MICGAVRCMELSVPTPCRPGFISTSSALLKAGQAASFQSAWLRVAAPKTFLLNSEEPNSFHSIRKLSLSPPPFPGSFPPGLHNRNRTVRAARTPSVSGGLQCSFFLLQAGSWVWFLTGCPAVPLRLAFPRAPHTRRSFLHGLFQQWVPIRTALISLLGPVSN